MFLVDGKMSWVRPLDDGRFAYWRRLHPPAILTQSELDEVQRLGAIALAVPYALAVPAIVIFLFWRAGTMPLTVVLVVAAIALVFSVVAVRSANRQRESILDAALAAPVEPLIPVGSRLSLTLRPLLAARSLVVLSGVMFFGAVAGSVGRLAGARNFTRPDGPPFLVMLIIAAVSGVVLFLSIRERRKLKRQGEQLPF